MVENLTGVIQPVTTWVGSWLRIIGISLGGVIGLYVISLALRAFQFARLEKRFKGFRKELKHITDRLDIIENAVVKKKISTKESIKESTKKSKKDLKIKVTKRKK